NIAEDGVCVIPISDGGDGLGDIKLGSIGCSVADGLGIKGDNKCGLGWLIIGGVIFIVIIALGGRRS
ncbi:MAG: hypothetical protein IID31_08815, partial [Planctomycetes bacterium]|nr:hypothetical protein [Planctomycetota bacterium]